MTELSAPCRRPSRTWLKGTAVACALALFCAQPCMAGSSEPLTRERLVGVWRLVRIEYSDPRGSTVDPFYQAASTGLLIYDSSGWMSVRISAPNRTAFEVPGRRVGPGSDDSSLDPSKRSAFHSYFV